jgi:hypothetical protein
VADLAALLLRCETGQEAALTTALQGYEGEPAYPACLAALAAEGSRLETEYNAKNVASLEAEATAFLTDARRCVRVLSLWFFFGDFVFNQRRQWHKLQESLLGPSWTSQTVRSSATDTAQNLSAQFSTLFGEFGSYPVHDTALAQLVDLNQQETTNTERIFQELTKDIVLACTGKAIAVLDTLALPPGPLPPSELRSRLDTSL